MVFAVTFLFTAYEALATWRRRCNRNGAGFDTGALVLVLVLVLVLLLSMSLSSCCCCCCC